MAKRLSKRTQHRIRISVANHSLMSLYDQDVCDSKRPRIDAANSSTSNLQQLRINPDDLPEVHSDSDEAFNTISRRDGNISDQFSTAVNQRRLVDYNNSNEDRSFPDLPLTPVRMKLPCRIHLYKI